VNMPYETGDHLAVFAVQDSKVVSALALRVGANLDTEITLTDGNGRSPFPCPCTVRHALSRYCDVSAVANSHTISALAACATDAFERRELLSKGPPRTVLALLTEYQSVDMSLAQLLEALPRLQPRLYSISSSSVAAPLSIHLSVSVVDDKLADGRVHRGVCSSYLKSQMSGSTVHGCVRRSSFRLPPTPSTPIVMVSTGTGFAPFRAFVQERQLAPAGSAADALLYHGCRLKTEFIYEREIREAVKRGDVSALHLALSREGGKIHVQDLLRETGDALARTIDNGAAVYVCGGTAMATAVHEALVDVLAQHHGGRAEAGRLLAVLEVEGRYLQDAWG